HESRLVTFYEALNKYEEDICLNLPFVGHMEWFQKVKRLVKAGSLNVPFTGTTERIFWTPSFTEKILLSFRDMIWTPLVNRAAKKYDLWDYDIYHLEGGMSFFRDGRDILPLKKKGKKIVSYYHGLGLRMRGAIRPVWEATDLNLTCEFDLYLRYPEVDYLFLPYDQSEVPQADPPEGKVRICHAPRIRSVKGTEEIINAVEELSREIPVELVLIENMSHSEVLRMKASCHIAVDQVASGDMGYGVNSLETLSMGIATVTSLSKTYQDFIPEHPFALTTPKTLKRDLRELVLDEDLRKKHAVAGPPWIRARHHWLSVAEEIHRIYREKGWETPQ
ncbi:MAG: glycosyltransferase, partial [Candidatus Fermentibacteraceae bacterium]|nr:glycosyltransferase [Candidatus Fermentibacteraceae bacterium]